MKDSDEKLIDRLIDECENKAKDEGFEVNINGRFWLRSAFDKYHKTKIKKITKKDIKDKAYILFGYDWTDNDVRESWIEGAEWILNKLK